ncbi:MAG TPA: ABC transporter substrate-binding protein [Methanospirillum sp.]|nr:ABC transporter substrate-binding protein [Methanospirillum sp.]
MREWIIIGILLTVICIGAVSGENQIVIGSIISESGDSASYGPGVEAAIDLAVSDLNDSYKAAGMNTTVVVKKAYVDGTKGDAEKAAEDLITQGVQIIVEPSSSEEVTGILPILSREGILTINPTSSLALSTPDDPIVRLCPDDLQLLKAIGKFNYMIAGNTPTKAVILSREDIYGRILSEQVTLCSNITDTVSYPQNSRDFTQTLNKLDAIVAPLIEELGEKNVVIFAISFDEISDLMAQASAYPNLRKARWQGMDSVALNPTVLENETAAEFADATGLTTLSYNIAQPSHSDYWRVYDAVIAATDGHQPSIYEILPYDETLMAAWIMQNNPSTIKEKLYLADNYGKYSYGATGWLKLNENGDREYGDYYFYQVKKGDTGKYTWVPVYVYMNSSNTIIPLNGVNNTYMQHFQES